MRICNCALPTMFGSQVCDNCGTKAEYVSTKSLSCENASEITRKPNANGDLISRAEAITRATHEGAYGYISAQELAEMPSAEHTAHIGDFTQYQIAWLTEHDDLELEPELESWVICFLKDTADCYEKEYLTSAERKGHWIDTDKFGEWWQTRYRCSECGNRVSNLSNYCSDCGARMVKDDRQS